jgi:7,8-dihydroneopterin aldolase/epimerase/oxygenase
MTTVRLSLAKLRFFGFHGIHPEEKIAGAEFEINMDICYGISETISRLEQTVDYTELYKIISEAMKVPYPLLETMGTTIANEVKSQYSQVTEINITISKINAPVVNFRGELGVTIHMTFE